MWNVVMVIRLPRVIGAVLAGAALALSGATYQGVFRNTLVSPDLLGVASGAGVGASIAILLHMPNWSIQVFAFILGIVAVLLTLTLPKLLKNNSTLMLVLSGVIVSGFISSVQGLLKYMADTDTELPSIIYWLMGSLVSVQWKSILPLFPAMVIAMIILMLFRWRINLLAFGEAESRSLGVNVRKMNRITIICSTVLTAGAVCMCGTIGWVGLVIPHLSRLLLGEDNRNILPSSILLGATFLLLVDTIARSISSAEIPLSVLTGMIGLPIFIVVLIRKKVLVNG
jgi:iron complex transport system permease protein